MALKIVRGAENAPIEPLRGRTVAVLGFGNQGHAHALNLRESGLEVVLGHRRDSESGRRAVECGFDPLPIEEAVRQGDLVVIALPDEVQPDLYERLIAPNLKPTATIGFLHGFAVRYGLIDPAPGYGVIMVAPKGPGRLLRQRYVDGQGLPCLLAVHREGASGDSEAIALAWANGIGCARAGVVYTSFAAETETDLFGEQVVLCGGLNWLILAAFETLTEAGYPPELAYLECCQEVKQIADLVYERGPAAMMEAISNTAEFGAHRAGPFLIDDTVRARMRQLLARVRDGTFADALRRDHDQGFPWFERQRNSTRRHAIEPAGEAVRRMYEEGTEARRHEGTK